MFQNIIGILLLIGTVTAFSFQLPKTQRKEVFRCPTNDNCYITGCLYANPEDCRTFYVCDYWGNAHLKQCPPYMAFNERIRTCDWHTQVAGCVPYNTNKPSTTIGSFSTERGPTSSSPISGSIAPITETTAIENQYSTQEQTDHTIEWITTETIGPIETESEQQSSEVPSATISTLSTDILTTTISSEFVCPISDIANTGCKEPTDCLYPNPSDCNSFIHCVPQIDGTGEPVVISCPPGQEWNENQKICDWPENSTCPNQQ